MNSSSSSTTRRTKPKAPCFVEKDNGLASLAETKAYGHGVSDTKNNNNCNQSGALHRKRSSSLRNLASLHHALPSPRTSAPPRFSFDARREDHHHYQNQPHFLDACSLCNKPLGDRDIFMYRGDTPFCSEECRQEQIEMDEAHEKSWNLSASMTALRKKDQRKSTSPNKTSQGCTFRISTVAAA